MVVFHMFDSHHCASVTKYYTVSFEMAVLTKKRDREPSKLDVLHEVVQKKIFEISFSQKFSYV